jgi:hypothetical protein
MPELEVKFAANAREKHNAANVHIARVMSDIRDAGFTEDECVAAAAVRMPPYAATSGACVCARTLQRDCTTARRNSTCT